MRYVHARDIVCLTKHPWNGPRFRKQRFMQHFSVRGHRVLYVQPSRSVLRHAGSADDPQPRLVGARFADPVPGIRVMTPSALFPKPMARSMLWVNHLKMTLEVRAVCRQAGITNPVLWVYDPHFAPFMTLLDPSAVVFDLVDDLQGYPYSPRSRKATAACIRRLCDHADRVLLTSEVLAGEYAPKAPSLVVPNGFDDEAFRVGDAGSRPAPTRRPRVGFVGALFGFLDYALLLHTILQLPEIDFVLVGRKYSDDPDLATLLTLPNVEYLGFVGSEKIPDIMRTFDVCLCPFKVDRVSRSVSPLKVYEYLALHKPVVATEMEGMRRDPVGPFIDFAGGRQEYVSLVRFRATEGRTFGDELDAVLGQATWKRRCELAAEFTSDILSEAGPSCG